MFFRWMQQIHFFKAEKMNLAQSTGSCLGWWTRIIYKCLRYKARNVETNVDTILKRKSILDFGRRKKLDWPL